MSSMRGPIGPRLTSRILQEEQNHDRGVDEDAKSVTRQIERAKASTPSTRINARFEVSYPRIPPSARIAASKSRSAFLCSAVGIGADEKNVF